MIFRPYVKESDYFIATYDMKSTVNLSHAAWNLAIGQSVGNPNVRNAWETDQLFEEHSCMVLHDEKELETQISGLVRIAYPVANTNWEQDGVSHLLCQLMGGQLDIDSIVRCRLVDVWFPPEVKRHFKGPKFGLKGARKFTGVYDKPLLGAIIKPKTGISPEVLLEMTKELVEGGVNFIKEDEIMSNPPCCPLAERVPLISNYIKGKGVIYAFCINADSPHLLERVKMVHQLGGNAVHVNFWSGIGAYKSIRDLDLPIFLHFQKSGDQILTNEEHKFGIDANVLYQIAAMSGVDTLHAGMIGGYSNSNPFTLRKTLNTLWEYDVVPALSCGMHPGLVDYVRSQIGSNWMANCGGSIHGHPNGTRQGATAMRQAIDGSSTRTSEYDMAVEKWGERKPKGIHVIIPAAGAGSRFSSYGFKVPKFLLPMDKNGKSMLQTAIETLNAPHCATYSVICQSACLEEIKNSLNINVAYKCVDYLTRGAAETTYHGLPEDSDVGIIVSNSDQVMQLWEVSEFVDKCGNSDGGVLTYRPPYALELNTIDKHSFAEIDNNWNCTRISEKKVISHHALVGVHYFRNKEIYIQAYNEMLKNHEQGELYVSELYSAMLRLNMTVKAVPLTSNQKFIPVGTPQDYLSHINPYMGPVNSSGDWKIEGLTIRVQKEPLPKDDEHNWNVIIDQIDSDNATVHCSSKERSAQIPSSNCILIKSPLLTECDVKDIQIKDTVRGWFLGDFEPSIKRISNMEIGLLTHEANEQWDAHVHREVVEYNYLVKGEMTLNEQEYKTGDSFIFPPRHLAVPKFKTKCIILCLKIPSKPTDKITY